MSTYVPNIGSVKPYEAESLDARFQRRRQDEQGNHDFSREDEHESWEEEEDGQILSVQALILFLEDFLESRLGAKLHKDVPKEPNAFEQWFRKKPDNCNAAAQAYKHGAKTAQSKTYSSSLKQKQSEMDLSHVYGLIRDLRHLRKSGIHVLRLSPDTDFMNGIALAIERAQRDLTV